MKLCVWGGACGWVPLLVVTPRPPPVHVLCVHQAGVWGLVTPCADFLLLPTFSVRRRPSAPESFWFTFCREYSCCLLWGGEGVPWLHRSVGTVPSSRQTRLQGTRHLQFAAFWDLIVSWVLRGFPVLASTQCSSPCIFSVVFLGLRLVSEGPSGLILWDFFFLSYFHLPFLLFYLLLDFFSFVFQSSRRCLKNSCHSFTFLIKLFISR